MSDATVKHFIRMAILTPIVILCFALAAAFASSDREFEGYALAAIIVQLVFSAISAHKAMRELPTRKAPHA